MVPDILEGTGRHSEVRHKPLRIGTVGSYSPKLGRARPQGAIGSPGGPSRPAERASEFHGYTAGSRSRMEGKAVRTTGGTGQVPAGAGRAGSGRPATRMPRPARRPPCRRCTDDGELDGARGARQEQARTSEGEGREAHRSTSAEPENRTAARRRYTDSVGEASATEAMMAA